MRITDTPHRNRDQMDSMNFRTIIAQSKRTHKDNPTYPRSFAETGGSLAWRIGRYTKVRGSDFILLISLDSSLRYSRTSPVQGFVSVGVSDSLWKRSTAVSPRFDLFRPVQTRPERERVRPTPLQSIEGTKIRRGAPEQRQEKKVTDTATHHRTISNPMSRSFNGCKRCKARRQKCDEQRPSCGRCQSAGTPCRYAMQLQWGGRAFSRSRFGACVGNGGMQKFGSFLPF